MENLMGKLKGQTWFAVIIGLAAKWLRILSLGGNTNFAKSTVKYLDHIMEKNGMRPGRDNLRAIREFERPKDKKM